MRLFIIFIFLVSCGKFNMPGYQDYGDSDGDQVFNKDETSFSDKKIAAVIPLEDVEAKLDFYEGLSNLKKHSLILGNNLDLNKYSKDLLVKSENHLKVNDYFTEFTSLQLKEEPEIYLEEQKFFPITLSFSKMKSAPENIYYVNGEEKILLGKWGPALQLSLTRGQLTAILKRQAQLSFSYLEDKRPYSDQSRAESIKDKTYRIFLNNGKTTVIYYVSKELKLEEILALFKIPEYRFVHDQNLLTTQITETQPEWWIRIIHKREIVVIFEDLKNLSAHYLKACKKVSQRLSRVNGYAMNEIDLLKDAKSKTLLTLSGSLQRVDFATKFKILAIKNPAPGQDTKCQQRSLEPTAETELPLTLAFLEKNLIFQSAGRNQAEQVVIREHRGEKGLIWEIQIPEGIDKIHIGLKNVDAQEYIATGPYSTDCFRTPPVMRTHESRLELNIEAFIENIK